MKIPSLKKLLSYARRVTDATDRCPEMKCVRLEAQDGMLTIDATTGVVNLRLRASCDGDLVPVAVNLRDLGKATDGKGEVTLSLGQRPADDSRRCETLHPTLEGALCSEARGHGTGHKAWSKATDYKDATWTGPAVTLVPLPDVPVLRVQVGGALTGDLDGLLAVDFPFVEQEDLITSSEVNVKDLCSTLDFLLPAVGTDDRRPQLGNVFFEGKRVYAVDGPRLHVDSSKVKIKKSALPLRAAKALRALLADCREETCIVHVVGYESRWQVTLPHGVRAYLSATWPKDLQWIPIDQVIPSCEPAAFQVAVKASDFAGVLDRVGGPKQGVFHARVVSLEINGVIKVSREDIDAGSVSREDVEAEISGSAGPFGMNADYLLEALKGLGERVTIARAADEETGPIRINGEDGRFAVVMGCRS